MWYKVYGWCGASAHANAVNIAVALSSQFGLRVGLLDADLAGPSIPQMMKLTDMRPDVASDKMQSLVPLENHGIKCMSMGFLVGADKALAWRGPMAGKALNQLLFQVVWGNLDVLVVDLPPGSGVPCSNFVHLCHWCHNAMTMACAISEIHRHFHVHASDCVPRCKGKFADH